ncbi:response regulator transcription factor [Parapedobacter indicus]|uniref:DNA-binding response regulator, NarL/FixJ family, contains REC and HTH domains n=1 Tax=Parapedobacter indicus TaxID=1477437 RepID=A0A1I3NT43_9SPHI|nr:response regulator transcription factor [Parapedobacter indicus]PPL01084.1 DNA-binding NarL/FixJ family response regulator [Parapedobacter indicus]SFJ12451.1 DNA-binding response regulator, NarL/FixJ family, contains REC and HTH domains [Parapedobacter indicus]
MHPIGSPIAVIYDDHLLFAESFSAVLERLTLFKSVHVFVGDEQAYLRFLVKNFDEPVYLFLDYYLPQKNALTLINETRRINKKARVIIVSSVSTPSIINHILTYDPDGFLSKSSGVDIVVDCLRTMSEGQLYICPVIREIINTKSLPTDTVPFTARELEMLHYFAQGLSIIDTATRAHLSKHTIVAHRRKMMTKAQVNSITELLAYARSKELI